MRSFPIDSFRKVETPFYYYDSGLLKKTLEEVKRLTEGKKIKVHFAIKANSNRKVLPIISSYGFGADCVSGGEIKAALECGFESNKIVFAGVGKSDKEIKLAIDKDIECFNVESIPELEVINQFAKEKGKTVNIAFRVNPNIEAHTHELITTGLKENKFGINLTQIFDAIEKLKDFTNVKFIGLHFHIGSQVLDMNDFIPLCKVINDLTKKLKEKGVVFDYLNLGGGLGVDYDNPRKNPIPDFEKYFKVYLDNLELSENQTLHFELGRSLVCQCGFLITKVLFVKHGEVKNFAICDAGMSELIRPALYQAIHQIENISNTDESKKEKYDVVGPICESSDVFRKDILLPVVQRGDYLSIFSAGAYGESMANCYNCRNIVSGYLFDD